MVATVLPRVDPASAGAAAPAASIAAVRTSMGTVRLALHRDFETLRDCWIRFQETALCSYAQTFAWTEGWFRLVAAPDGAKPALVCGTSETGRTLFIWPFETVRARGVRSLRWIGQAHNSYNLGLYDHDFARRVLPGDVEALLNEAARLTGDVAAAELCNQPVQWDGIRNPFAALPRRPHADSGHAVILDTDFDTLYRNLFSGKSRNALHRKMRRMAVDGRVRMEWADTEAERGRLLDAFFAQSSQEAAGTGHAAPLADPRHQAFYREMASLPEGARPRLDVGYLKVGDGVAAWLNGVGFRNRYTILQPSTDESCAQCAPPDPVLLRHKIEETCRAGLDYFDMGAGSAPHKSDWCALEIPLFESVIPFRETGRSITLPRAARSELKRFVERRTGLRALAQTVRRGVSAPRTASAPNPD